MSKTRRTFIKNASVAALAAGLAPNTMSSTSAAPSDRVNIGLIGCRNMGFGDLKKHLRIPGVQCVAMCDVDENILREKAAIVEKEFSQKPKLYDDFRKLLENKDLDAVIIGTPDHWHALPMIYACQAGLDVYVEKPMANSIQECSLMVKAAKKYNRVVQVGQQQRSGTMWREIMQTIHAGALGKLRKVEIWANFNYGVGGSVQPDASVPKGVDFNFWLGPAPERSFNPARFHGNWRMFWDYGGGLVTDWGVHLIDMALWAGNVTKAPETVLAFGKNLSFENNAHETFDTMSVVFPLDDYVITWEHTAGTQTGPYHRHYGLAFRCDLGTILANRDGYEILPEWDNSQKKNKVEKFIYKKGREHHTEHAINFVECIKTREQTVCPPEVGRQVALYAHMANIAARCGENKVEWDEEKNQFKNSDAANSFVSPQYRAPWTLPKI
jgi:predicted dehydrogenase